MSARPRYRIGYAVAVAAVALAAAACSAPGSSSSSSQPAAGSTGSGTAAAASGPIKIAVVDAQSGSSSDLGQFEYRGVKLAVSQANAAGGIDGRQIQLTLYDDQGDPTVGTELARKIAADGDVAMLGTAESAVTLAMAPILKSEQIPNITSGQSTKLTDLHSPFLFLNGPTGLTYDSTLANYLVKNKGYKKIAMITNNDSYGAGEESAFSSSLKSLGLSAVAAQVVPADQTNMTPALTTIRGSNPQVLFIGAEEAQSGLIVKQARALGMTAVIAEGAPAGHAAVHVHRRRRQRERHDRQLAVPRQRRVRRREDVRGRLHRRLRQRAGTARCQGLRRREDHDRRAEVLQRVHRAEPGQRDSRHPVRRAARQLQAYDSSGVGIFATAIGIIANGKIEPVS